MKLIKTKENKFIDKQCALAQVKGGSWHKSVKRLFARPGDVVDSSFILPNHQELGLTNLQSAEKINAFFLSF